MTRIPAFLALALVASTFASAAAPAPLLTKVAGTVALYQFDEGTGTVINDTSGNGKNGTLQGNASWEQGISGQALNFPPGGYVQVPSLAIGSNWTIQAWTRFPLGALDGGYWTLARNGDGYHHILVNSAGVLGTHNGSWLASKTTAGGDFNVSAILPGWHLLSAVGSASKTTFYVDANPVSVAAAQVTSTINSIGSADIRTQPWGVVDSVRILNVARSAAEIAGDASSDPAAPTSLQQIDPASLAVAPVGAVLARPAVRLQAAVTTRLGSMAGLAVEVKPIGQAFTGQATAIGGMVASGSVATVTVTGLPSSQACHWQGWTVEDTGAVSPKAAFGGNAETVSDFETPAPNPPPTIASTEQKNAGTNTVIAKGGSGYDRDGLSITATIIDPSNDDVRLEAEVVLAGASFGNQATVSSGLIGSGSAATVSVDLAPGSYVWQVRGVSAWGVPGAWTPGGGAPDVVIVDNGSDGRAYSDALTCSASGEAALLLLPLAAALLLAGSRIR